MAKFPDHTWDQERPNIIVFKEIHQEGGHVYEEHVGSVVRLRGGKRYIAFYVDPKTGVSSRMPGEWSRQSIAQNTVFIRWVAEKESQP